MMTLTQYYLIKLAEEAAEVAQIALKAAHFGMSETQPGRDESNAQRIYAELNDVLAMIAPLERVSRGEFSFDPDEAAMRAKQAKVAHYLAYSQSLGLVERETAPERCYAPSCGQWDGNDSCTCQHLSQPASGDKP